MDTQAHRQDSGLQTSLRLVTMGSLADALASRTRRSQVTKRNPQWTEMKANDPLRSRSRLVRFYVRDSCSLAVMLTPYRILMYPAPALLPLRGF
jgi:hypothetical protein